jgi:AcrR family transcriptional regulator
MRERDHHMNVTLDRDPNAAAGRPGRPRRFSADAEMQMILDAAMTVMRRDVSADANVTEIIEQAGLSTRAFYRHFASKDELLRALHRREAERAAARVVERLSAATTPRSQLVAWVDEQLSLVYDDRKAVRVALLSSEVAQRAASAEYGYVRQLMLDPLVGVLRRGLADGTFPAADPDNHALSIYALISGLLRTAIAGERVWPSQSTAVAEVIAFCLPALGAATRSAQPGESVTR